jgi:hypothetical protein
MANPIDAAWTLLKSIDFNDIGPMPTRFKIHPDNVPYEGGEPRTEQESQMLEELWQEDPERNQRWMEESYTPDVQAMLELEALRQASEAAEPATGGRQVPRNLLMPRQEYGYEEEPWERNFGATSSHEMNNLPQGGTDEFPIPQSDYN